MSDPYFRYIQLKSQEHYEETKTPYCAGCDKINPSTTVFHGKLKDIIVCAECGMSISYKVTKKLIRPKELIDFIQGLPSYRKEGDRYVFSDGAVVEPRTQGFAMWGWSTTERIEGIHELYCTKCEKWRHQGCLHFVSLEEGVE